MDAELLVETDGTVATFTLIRPERLNAIGPRMIDELDAALVAATADDAVRVIRLRGAGRAFCSGYDLEWAAELMREIVCAEDARIGYPAGARVRPPTTATWFHRLGLGTVRARDEPFGDYGFGSRTVADPLA